MKNVIYGLMAFFLPLMILIGVYRHVPLTYNSETNHYEDTYKTSEMVNYFVDSYALDTQRFQDSISDMGYIFTSDNWDYKNYVQYDYITFDSANNIGQWLEILGKNFVSFFRMLGNFFANAGMYFKNVGMIFYNGYRIVLNVGWIVFTLQFKLLKLAGYVIGFGG